jgi:UDP-N-acetylmuramoyl-L-alanyl-D-glutamate--2,6-diaminopimelate ligase
MEKILRTIKKIIPKNLFKALQPWYHFMLSFLGAVIYRFPSRRINVVFITGTKGKTSTAELVVAMLEEARHTVALAGTLRFKIGSVSRRNMYKMTIPGRFFVQQFLRQAVTAGCEYAVIEMTSEGAVQYRHAFIAPNALIFTNLSPEHIESHGSFEKYVQAKLMLAESLEHSHKPDRVLVTNADDKEAVKFKMATPSASQNDFSLRDAEPYIIKPEGIEFTFKNEHISAHLSGTFNLYNILAAATYASSQAISTAIIKRAIEKFTGIRGRVEKVESGQDFSAIVDYAHTPDSLENLYKAFVHTKTICVLGNTGGGRDKWKRKDMAEIAGAYCSSIILTDEDPYDEDPRSIVEDMHTHIATKPVEIIMDRREAIHAALARAKKGEAVLITGKGTDPYIMQANGVKLPWDDATVVREELAKIAK